LGALRFRKLPLQLVLQALDLASSLIAFLEKLS